MSIIIPGGFIVESDEEGVSIIPAPPSPQESAVASTYNVSTIVSSASSSVPSRDTVSAAIALVRAKQIAKTAIQRAEDHILQPRSSSSEYTAASESSSKNKVAITKMLVEGENTVPFPPPSGEKRGLNLNLQAPSARSSSTITEINPPNRSDAMPAEIRDSSQLSSDAIPAVPRMSVRGSFDDIEEFEETVDAKTIDDVNEFLNRLGVGAFCADSTDSITAVDSIEKLRMAGSSYTSGDSDHDDDHDDDEDQSAFGELQPDKLAEISKFIDSVRQKEKEWRRLQEEGTEQRLEVLEAEEPSVQADDVFDPTRIVDAETEFSRKLRPTPIYELLEDKQACKDPPPTTDLEDTDDNKVDPPAPPRQMEATEQVQHDEKQVVNPFLDLSYQEEEPLEPSDPSPTAVPVDHYDDDEERINSDPDEPYKDQYVDKSFTGSSMLKTLSTVEEVASTEAEEDMSANDNQSPKSEDAELSVQKEEENAQEIITPQVASFEEQESVYGTDGKKEPKGSYKKADVEVEKIPLTDVGVVEQNMNSDMSVMSADSQHVGIDTQDEKKTAESSDICDTTSSIISRGLSEADSVPWALRDVASEETMRATGRRRPRFVVSGPRPSSKSRNNVASLFDDTSIQASEAASELKNDTSYGSENKSGESDEKSEDNKEENNEENEILSPDSAEPDRCVVDNILYNDYEPEDDYALLRGASEGTISNDENDEAKDMEAKEGDEEEQCNSTVVLKENEIIGAENIEVVEGYGVCGDLYDEYQPEDDYAALRAASEETISNDENDEAKGIEINVGDEAEPCNPAVADPENDIEINVGDEAEPCNPTTADTENEVVEAEESIEVVEGNDVCGEEKMEGGVSHEDDLSENDEEVLVHASSEVVGKENIESVEQNEKESVGNITIVDDENIESIEEISPHNREGDEPAQEPSKDVDRGGGVLSRDPSGEMTGFEVGEGILSPTKISRLVTSVGGISSEDKNAERQQFIDLIVPLVNGHEPTMVEMAQIRQIAQRANISLQVVDQFLDVFVDGGVEGDLQASRSSDEMGMKSLAVSFDYKDEDDADIEAFMIRIQEQHKIATMKKISTLAAEIEEQHEISKKNIEAAEQASSQILEDEGEEPDLDRSEQMNGFEVGEGFVSPTKINRIITAVNTEEDRKGERKQLMDLIVPLINGHKPTLVEMARIRQTAERANISLQMVDQFLDEFSDKGSQIDLKASVSNELVVKSFGSSFDCKNEDDDNIEAFMIRIQEQREIAARNIQTTTECENQKLAREPSGEMDGDQTIAGDPSIELGGFEVGEGFLSPTKISRFVTAIRSDQLEEERRQFMDLIIPLIKGHEPTLVEIAQIRQTAQKANISLQVVDQFLDGFSDRSRIDLKASSSDELVMKSWGSSFEYKNENNEDVEAFMTRVEEQRRIAARKAISALASDIEAGFKAEEEEEAAAAPEEVEQNNSFLRQFEELSFDEEETDEMLKENILSESQNVDDGNDVADTMSAQALMNYFSTIDLREFEGENEEKLVKDFKRLMLPIMNGKKPTIIEEAQVRQAALKANVPLNYVDEFIEYVKDEKPEVVLPQLSLEDEKDFLAKGWEDIEDINEDAAIAVFLSSKFVAKESASKTLHDESHDSGVGEQKMSMYIGSRDYNPEDDSAVSTIEPDFTKTKTEESMIEPDFTKTKTEESMIEPDFTKTKTEESMIEPDFTKTKTEESMIVPDFTTTKTEESMIEPDFTTTKTEESMVEPGFTKTKTEEGSDCEVVGCAPSINDDTRDATRESEESDEEQEQNTSDNELSQSVSKIVGAILKQEVGVDPTEMLKACRKIQRFDEGLWQRRAAMATYGWEWKEKTWLSQTKYPKASNLGGVGVNGILAGKDKSNFMFNKNSFPLTRKTCKLSYSRRVKPHTGYLDVDVYSLQECAVGDRNLRMDETPWELRNVRQRFLHERSLSFSRNWFGQLVKTDGNDKIKAPICKPKSMEMPMRNVPDPGDWTPEWYTSWGDKRHLLPRPSTETSSYTRNTYGESYGESYSASKDDYTVEDDDSTRDDDYEKDSLRSYSTGSTFSDDDEDDEWEDAPECGTLVNTKLKIGEHVSRVHPDYTSSLRKSRWRKKYFPIGTFPY